MLSDNFLTLSRRVAVQVNTWGFSMAGSEDVIAGMETAKQQFMSFVQTAVNIIVVPIISVVVGVFMLINIAACVKRHQGQQQYSDKLITVLICLVVLVLVATFPLWGWQMLGVGTEHNGGGREF